jgi:hypothetical protein
MISKLSSLIDVLLIFTILLLSKFSISNFTIRPFGPEPFTNFKSKFNCFASLLANGETKILFTSFVIKLFLFISIFKLGLSFISDLISKLIFLIASGFTFFIAEGISELLRVPPS